MPNDAIHAPWSPATVIALNQQQHGIRHMYTCPLHEVRDAPALVATSGGWICSHSPDCDYTQDWAHLVDVRYLDELRHSLETPVDDYTPEPESPPEPQPTMDDVASAAYAAYVRAAGGKAVNGDTLPAWEDVTPHVQTSWRAAVRQVLQMQVDPSRMGVFDLTMPGQSR